MSHALPLELMVHSPFRGQAPAQPAPAISQGGDPVTLPKPAERRQRGNKPSIVALDSAPLLVPDPPSEPYCL